MIVQHNLPILVLIVVGVICVTVALIAREKCTTPWKLHAWYVHVSREKEGVVAATTLLM